MRLFCDIVIYMFDVKILSICFVFLFFGINVFNVVFYIGKWLMEDGLWFFDYFLIIYGNEKVFFFMVILEKGKVL